MPKASQFTAVLDALWIQNEALLKHEKNRSAKDFLCGRKDALNQVCGLVRIIREKKRDR
jgi:hypothetical protein